MPPSWNLAASPPRTARLSSNLLRRWRGRFRIWTPVGYRRRGGSRGRCWRRANLPHRFEQVRRLPGDVDVMLAHPRRGVAEKFGQRLDVHSIQDGPRAKPAVPRSGGGTAAVRGSARPRSPPDGACGRMGRPFGRRGSGSRPSFARVAPPRCSGRGAFSFTRRASWVARSVAKRAF